MTSGRPRAPGDALRELLPLLALAGLVALFFSSVLGHRSHIPYDLNGYYYPLLSVVARGLRAGALPHWDPYLYGGMPLAGNPQAQLFYPPTLLFLWLAGGDVLSFRQVELLLIGHALLAGIAAYLALRHGFALARQAALLGGAVYVFGGFVGSFSSHLGSISGAAWLPLVLWGTKRAVERLSARAAWGAGVALALLVLSGFPPFALMVVTGLGLAGLAVAGQALAARDPRRALRAAALVVLVLVVGAALAAVQLVPAWEAATRSIAGDRPAHFSVQGIQRESYLTLLLPNAAGIGSGEAFGLDGRPLLYLYVGVLPLALAAIGMRAGPAGDRALLIGLLLLGVLWMVGDLVVVSRVLAQLTPAVVGRGYYPFLAMVLLDLAVAGLAALGADALVRPRAEASPWIARVQAGVGCGLGASGLLALVFQFLLYMRPPADPLRPIRVIEGLWALALLAGVSWGVLAWARRALPGRRSAAGWAMVGVVALDLLSFGAGRPFNAQAGSPESILGPTSLRERSALIRWLQADPDLGRGRYYRIDVHARDTLWYLAPRLWRLESANGDDPLLLRSYREVRQLFSVSEDLSVRWGPYRRFALRDPASPVVDLLGIRYIVADDTLPAEVVARAGGRLSLVSVMDGHRVYRNASPLARATVVSGAVVVEGPLAALRYMGSDRFVPQEHAVVTAADGAGLPAALRLGPDARPAPEGGAPGTAEVVASRADRLTLRASLHRPGLLHVSDPYFPGWRVSVDGREQAIIRANGAFRAVVLDAGEHEVIFRYAPLSVRIGLALSAVAALTSVAALTVSWRRARRLARP